MSESTRTAPHAAGLSWHCVAVVCVLATALTTSALAKPPAPSLLFGAKGELWRRDGRLPDVSTVGYGGGSALPLKLPIRRSALDFGAQGDGVHDDTKAIQAALDAEPAGVVWLPAGTYRVTAPLWLRRSGTVLRGAGSHAGGSVIRACTALSGPLLRVAPKPQQDVVVTQVTKPAIRGDTVLQVVTTQGLQVGERLVLRLSDTAQHSLRSHLEGAPTQTCTDQPITLRLPVRVVAFTATTVRLRHRLRHDVLPAWKPTLIRAARLHEVGVEHVRLARPDPVLLSSTKATGDGLLLDRVSDGWALDVVTDQASVAFAVTAARHVTLDKLVAVGRKGDGLLTIDASWDLHVISATANQLSSLGLRVRGPGGGVVVGGLATISTAAKLSVAGRGLHDLVLQGLTLSSFSWLSSTATCGYGPGRRFTVWGETFGTLLPGVSQLPAHTTVASPVCGLPDLPSTQAWLEQASGPDLVLGQRQLASQPVFGHGNAADVRLWRVGDGGRWWSGVEEGRGVWRLLSASLPNTGPGLLREVAVKSASTPTSRRFAARLRDAADAALVLAWQGPDDYLYVTPGDAKSGARVVRVVKGAASVLSPAGAPGWPAAGGWRDVRATLTPTPAGDHQATLHVDGKLLAKATVTGKLMHKVALGSLGGGFDVDDLWVSQASCVPKCGGVTCGPDGCGGSCGTCDDGNVCTADTCKGQTCAHAAWDGPCDDGNPCTYRSMCSKQACVGKWTCNDGNPCTQDSCVAGKCKHTPTSNTPCDDCNSCTAGDMCVTGVCQSGSNVCGCVQDQDCMSQWWGGNCGGDLYCDNLKSINFCKIAPGTKTDCANPCPGGCGKGVALFCGLQSRKCEQAATTDGATCDDGDACTGAGDCKEGACTAGKSKSCDDQSSCTLDACAKGKGCTHTPKVCNDGVGCTTDACVAGVGCVALPSAATCDDADACTVDTCDAAKGCVHSLVDCEDGDPCTTDTCAKTLGCGHQAASGAACDDGDPCTGLDTCKAGVCLGVPVACGVPSGPVDAGGVDGGGLDGAVSDGVGVDGQTTDAGAKDAESTDALAKDIGATDASLDTVVFDAVATDAVATDVGGGGQPDAGAKDGPDGDAAGTDVGSLDAAAPDVGSHDAGTADASAPDAASADVGAPDAGSSDASVADGAGPDTAPGAADATPDATSADTGSPDSNVDDISDATTGPSDHDAGGTAAGTGGKQRSGSGCATSRAGGAQPWWVLVFAALLLWNRRMSERQRPCSRRRAMP